MIVGFDAIRMYRNFTGLGNYSRFVLRVLAAHAPEHRYRLYTPDEGLAEGRARIAAALGGRWPGHVTAVTPRWVAGTPLASTLWRTFGLGRRAAADGVDLFHGLSHELPRDLPRPPRRGPAAVVTMHDLIYLHFPHYFNPVDVRLYDWKFRASCRRADLVLAVSERTRRDVVEHYGIPADRVRVVHQGCDPRFHEPVTPAAAEAVRRDYGLGRDYLLSVGTIEERKNLGLMVEALAALPAARRPELVMVGRPTPYLDAVRERAAALGVADRLRPLHGVPQADLPALYAGAALFVYPSRYEGFGIPLLEAMAVGAPALAARGSCLEEVGGEAAVYIDPDDTEAAADTLARLLDDGAARADMAAAGRARAARFADERIAADLLSAYREAIDRR